MTTAATIEVERPQYTITLGVAPGNGGGSGTPATTVTDETTWAVPKAVGVSTNYAREDHTHGTPAAPTASSVGAVPTARILTTTAPLTIGGGASADLSADRTLAIATATTTTQGTVEIATDGETGSGVVPTGADFRLKHSLWVALNSAINVTFNNAPAAATEVFASVGAYRAHVNLFGFKYVRFYVRISTTAPASGSRCTLQYSLDRGANWRNMDVESGSSASPDTGAVVTQAPWGTISTYDSGKVAIAAAARADDVWLRCLTDGGDGVIDWIGQKLEAVFTEA